MGAAQRGMGAYSLENEQVTDNRESSCWHFPGKSVFPTHAVLVLNLHNTLGRDLDRCDEREVRFSLDIGHRVFTIVEFQDVEGPPRGEAHL